MKTPFLGAAILAQSSVTWAEPTSTLPEEKATDYMSKVRPCLDNLLEHGTDHYGPVHTSMLMSIMDTRTNESPREPEELDGLIRSEGRLHRLNYRGADLWDDQPLIRTLYTMTDVTDDARYADAAAAYIQDYFTYAKKENGSLIVDLHSCSIRHTDLSPIWSLKKKNHCFWYLRSSKRAVIYLGE